MIPPVQARPAYASAAPARVPRAAACEILARIAPRRAARDETDRAAFPAAGAPAPGDRRPWMALAGDPGEEGGALPAGLRARLAAGPAEFVRKHRPRARAGTAPAAPLVDVGASLMRGLRGGGTARA